MITGILLLAAGALAALNVTYTGERPAIRGVNLGGWLVMEPWITPQKFQDALDLTGYDAMYDEWTIQEQLTKKFDADYAKNWMNQHYEEWVTQDDMQRLKKMGITHIRIPVGYWMVDVADDEPWVTGGWDYLLKAMGWARDADLECLIDLHGVPGSQNGFDNSGKRGGVHWMEGDNIARSVDLLTKLVTNLLSSDVSDVFWGVELVNEPFTPGGMPLYMTQMYYLDMYTKIRALSQDLIIVAHDAFAWDSMQGFMRPDQGFVNIIMDTHIYQVFDSTSLSRNYSAHLCDSCSAGERNAGGTLWTITGEYCLATTDCAYWLNGQGRGARYDGTLDNYPYIGECNRNETSTWDDDYKSFLMQFALNQFAAWTEGQGVGWFFWNFKTEGNTQPQWDYMWLADNGYINSPPESAYCKCDSKQAKYTAPTRPVLN